MKEFIGLKSIIGGLGTVGLVYLFLNKNNQKQPKKKKMEEKKTEKNNDTDQPKDKETIKPKNKMSIQKYIQLINLREDVLNSLQIVKEIAEKEDFLIAKLYYGESLILSNFKEQGLKILKEITESTSKDPYDIFAIAKASHLLGNKKKAFETYHNALDCPFTYSHIGIYYQYAIETKEDINKAKEYYQLGVKKSDPLSNYMLGLLEVSQQNEEGFIRIEKCASLNFIPALMILKDLYNQRQEHYKVIQIFSQLEKLNHVPTLLEIAIMKYPMEPIESEEKIKLYAQSGSPNAQAALIDLYVEKKPSEALKIAKYYLEKSKNSEVLFRMAILYEEGIGCEKDIKKSCEYLKEASDMGNLEAQFAYSKYLIEGKEDGDVKQNLEKGLQNMQELAVKGISDAFEYIQEYNEKIQNSK